MMRGVLSGVLTVVMIIAHNCCAQQNVVISGAVRDSLSLAPLPYASIKLVSTVDSALLEGAITDTGGTFSLDHILPGQYTCVVEYIGYAQKAISVEVKNKKNINLGLIQLTPVATLLNELVIQGKKKKQMLVDRDVYNVDSMDLSKIVTTAALMKTIPEIKVNVVNNDIRIKGKASTLVMINGIYRSDEQVDLRSINPGDIQKIEIISMPTSVHNSDVDGVVNIVLKANPTSGLTTYIDVGYITLNKSLEPSLMFQYGTKRLRLSVDYFPSWKSYPYNSDVYRELVTGDSVRRVYSLESTNLYRSDQTNILKTKLDFYINKNNYLNITTSNILYFAASDEAISTLYKDSSILYNAHTLKEFNKATFLSNTTVYYQKSFLKSDQNFTANYNFHYMDVDYKEIYHDTIANINTIENRKNYTLGTKLSHNLILTYNHPFGNNKLSIGILGYHQIFENRQEDNDALINLLHSNARIRLFADFYILLKSITCRMGANYEKYLSSMNRTAYVNMGIFLPSIVLSKKLNQNNTMRCSYRKTSFYPSVWQLSPVLIYNDSLTAFIGNPDLKPLIYHYVELSNTYMKGDNYLQMAAYYKNEINAINLTNHIADDNVMVSSFENVNGITRFGTNFSSSLMILKNIDFEPSISLYVEGYHFFDHGKKNYSLDVDFSVGYALPRDYYIGLDFYYYGKKLTYQGFSEHQPQISVIYLDKTIMKGNGSLQIGYCSPFFVNEDKQTDFTDSFMQISSQTTYTEGVLVKFSYYFSKGKEIKFLHFRKYMEKDVK